jgi:hypothetical protein
MEEIINSYYNGQFKQMVRQIDEYGVSDFATELKHSDESYLLDDSLKFQILRMYLMLKN